MGRLATVVARHPKTILAATAVLTVLAVAEVRTFGAGQLEYNFSRMRRADTWQTGEGFWGRRMDTLLGQYLTPTVILVDHPHEASAVAARFRVAMASPPLDAMVDRIRTLADLVPVDQSDRQAELARIRKKLTPNAREMMTPKQREQVDAFLGASPPPPIGLADVPESLLKGLLERNGRADRAILVYPKLAAGLWDGPRNAAFVGALRAAAMAPTEMGGHPARVAGGPPITADIIASMSHDGPLASLLAFLGVVLTVVLLFRGRVATPFVLGALLLGVSWMLALCMALGIKINFINFIAFPITFGIGVDYAVNVMARYMGDGRRDVRGAIMGTGGAVGLCSLTTILGYSSLLVAKNLGLFYFGFLAVLGEITCLVIAVIAMPAALVWWDGRKRNA
jgi:hypothetical protein